MFFRNHGIGVINAAAREKPAAIANPTTLKQMNPTKQKKSKRKMMAMTTQDQICHFR